MNLNQMQTKLDALRAGLAAQQDEQHAADEIEHDLLAMRQARYNPEELLQVWGRISEKYGTEPRSIWMTEPFGEEQRNQLKSMTDAELDQLEAILLAKKARQG